MSLKTTTSSIGMFALVLVLGGCVYEEVEPNNNFVEGLVNNYIDFISTPNNPTGRVAGIYGDVSTGWDPEDHSFVNPPDPNRDRFVAPLIILNPGSNVHWQARFGATYVIDQSYSCPPGKKGCSFSPAPFIFPKNQVLWVIIDGNTPANPSNPNAAGYSWGLMAP